MAGLSKGGIFSIFREHLVTGSFIGVHSKTTFLSRKSIIKRKINHSRKPLRSPRVFYNEQ
jgi:hypothetical protein